ncbi:Ficolin-1 [Apostichopus japonicus]|uniref:Ficolin-1 n=1 Tax=Stichopus japonicus TaxID=307972 RepID=A0A2G8K693_STIJA|nr:Ficolin-1 [Apostichopus japonicus]
MQESKEPTTAVTTEPQGTTLGDNARIKEPTTAVTTEPQGTTLGSTIYTCPPNMIYGNCTCEATCEDPKGESACNSTCLGSTGCICKAGLMLNGSDCISASRCSCFVTRPTWLYRMKYDSVIVMRDTKVTVKLCVQRPYRWLYEFFIKHWAAYKDRFGDSRNLWLGNEKLHYLTNQRNYKLRFDITSSSGLARYAEYTDFQIESETSNYTMSELGNEGGNTGYRSMIQRKTIQHHDRDNDAFGNFNCAEKHRSGWWHSNDDCSTCASNSFAIIPIQQQLQISLYE